MKKVFFVLCSYVPILIAMEAYGEAVMVQLVIGFYAFWVSVFMTIFSSNMKQFKMFNLNLFIGTIIGYVTSGVLFLNHISDDNDSVIIFMGIVFVAVVAFCIQYFIEYQIKSSKLREQI